jgi:hypothetical protein
MKKIIDILLSKKYAMTMTAFVLLIPFAYATADSSQTNTNESSTTPLMKVSTLYFSTTTKPYIVSEPKFGTEEKVRKGKILEKNDASNSFQFQIGTSTVLVNYTATTTFYTGDDTEIYREDLDSGSSVYVFGYIRDDKEVINAAKVIIANKAKYWSLRSN